MIVAGGSRKLGRTSGFEPKRSPDATQSEKWNEAMIAVDDRENVQHVREPVSVGACALASVENACGAQGAWARQAADNAARGPMAAYP